MDRESKFFVYSDVNGNITGRQVSDISENDIYIQALCHKAQNIRTFRKDRILEYVSDHYCPKTEFR